MHLRLLACCIVLLMGQSARTSHAAELKFSATTGLETRLFTESALQNQSDVSASLMALPEWYWRWDDSSFTFEPFIRIDSQDEERTHADIRQAYYETVGDDWSLRVGINKVFWGVAETQHLVDIINQTDLVENIDGEDKLGQPMINYSFEKEWGTLDLFLLPGFRERTFPGEDGRLRPVIPINNDNPLYESSEGQSHIDYALRYFTSIEQWDLGVSWFEGTSREPEFVINFGPDFSTELVPFYPQITQVGIDLQSTFEDWLLKFEAIYRKGFGEEDYLAWVGGFEYTYYGVFESAVDFGIVAEYQYDDRQDFGDSFAGIELTDVFILGGRFALNDEQSTDLLVGIGAETDDDVRFLTLEGSRRIGDDMKLSIEGRIFSGIARDGFTDTLFFSFRNDDFVQITLEKFY